MIVEKGSFYHTDSVNAAPARSVLQVITLQNVPVVVLLEVNSKKSIYLYILKKIKCHSQKRRNSKYIVL